MTFLVLILAPAFAAGALWGAHNQRRATAGWKRAAESYREAADAERARWAPPPAEPRVLGSNVHRGEDHPWGRPR